MRTLRLNFSYPDLDQLDEGIRRLARAIEAELADRLPVRPPVRNTRGYVNAVPVPGEHALNQLSWNLALSEVVE